MPLLKKPHLTIETGFDKALSKIDKILEKRRSEELIKHYKEKDQVDVKDFAEILSRNPSLGKPKPSLGQEKKSRSSNKASRKKNYIDKVQSTLSTSRALGLKNKKIDYQQFKDLFKSKKNSQTFLRRSSNLSKKKASSQRRGSSELNPKSSSLSKRYSRAHPENQTLVPRIQLESGLNTDRMSKQIDFQDRVSPMVSDRFLRQKSMSHMASLLNTARHKIPAYLQKGTSKTFQSKKISLFKNTALSSIEQPKSRRDQKENPQLSQRSNLNPNWLMTLGQLKNQINQISIFDKARTGKRGRISKDQSLKKMGAVSATSRKKKNKDLTQNKYEKISKLHSRLFRKDSNPMIKSHSKNIGWGESSLESSKSPITLDRMKSANSFKSNIRHNNSGKLIQLSSVLKPAQSACSSASHLKMKQLEAIGLGSKKKLVTNPVDFNSNDINCLFVSRTDAFSYSRPDTLTVTGVTSKANGSISSCSTKPKGTHLSGNANQIRVGLPLTLATSYSSRFGLDPNGVLVSPQGICQVAETGPHLPEKKRYACGPRFIHHQKQEKKKKA